MKTKNMTGEWFFPRLLQNIMYIVYIFTISWILLHPIFGVNAAIVDGSWNSISWANNNFVNLANSGAYQINFSLSGTFDAGDTFRVTARDGSGNTQTWSYLSLSGWESSGSLVLNLSSSVQGQISYSGQVYSGSISSQVVASGITLTGTLDTIIPGVILSSTGWGTISWATLIHIVSSENAVGLTLADISIVNATGSNFISNSSTGYTLTITPSQSSGTITVSVGTGSFTDISGNPNPPSNTLTFSISTADIVAPVVTITSLASGATVTGSPTISGTVTDTGWVASVTVNGSTATLGTWTWSRVVSGLTGWANTITVIATDTAGNTGSTSIIVNRVSLPSNVDVELSGTTSAVIIFNTDISATGVVLYGTWVSTLNQSATGTTPGTSHSFVLTGLLVDTIYYFRVQWQGGTQSAIMQFKTPRVISNSATWSIVATGSVYLSGSTATGVTFLGSGSIAILSITSTGSQLSFPFNGLTITASWWGWDGVIQAPEITSNVVGLTLSGYTFTGTAYEIGNPDTELIFSGQTATITILLGSSLSGQTVKVFRSTNWGSSYTELTTCIITGWGNCTFTTNQLSLFGFAIPADTTPSAFSFSAVTNAEPSTQYTSNSIVLAGTNAPAIISISGGSYSINGGAFINTNGSINTWDSVVVRATSSAWFSTTTNTALTIGGVVSTYNITTKASTGGGGSGPGGPGGGGGWTPSDICPAGDYSPSYYDWICGVPWTWGGPIVVITPPGTFNIPPIIIGDADIQFRDTRNNWAKNFIRNLVVRGIVNNVVRYRPEDNLTRAEFLKIVLKTTGWIIPTKDLNIPFDDVTMNSWYAKYISFALSKGMINQLSVSFRPNFTITRAEATKILMVAIWITVLEPTTLTFTDVNPSSDLTKYIEAAGALGVISGQRENGARIFRPNDSITRAEIAKIVSNAFWL